MEIKASATYLRISPRKLRLLTYGLRGMLAKKALAKIDFYPQRGKEIVAKLFKQGIANAVNNFKLDPDKLFLKTIEVNEGPRSKRQDKSHGARFDRGIIHKKMAHISLVLETKEPKITDKKLEIIEKKVKKVSNNLKKAALPVPEK